MNSTFTKQTTINVNTHQQFLLDVIKGLSARQKFLESKYFYNAKGDELFKKIMGCEEYYLTRCEMEIFTKQTAEFASTIINNLDEFDVVELGAGDASKSIYLLAELQKAGLDFTYFPVDISKDVIDFLQKDLPNKLPKLNVSGLNGEYFEMLEKADEISDKQKVVLFLGSNIGNFSLDEANEFCATLRSLLLPGDLIIIGFDLKKDPRIILDAYNDKAGITRDFNLNLLKRINKELGGDFAIENFSHTPVYEESTGECKSFLTSKISQVVRVEQHQFYFARGEKIYMEISQKFSVDQIDKLATNNGFNPLNHFYDSKNWFVDAIWQCV